MKIPVVPSGNIDSENDIPFIKKGDIRDALDVTPISDGNGNTNSWEPIKGNLYAYSLGVQGIQGKTIRIFLETGLSSYEFDFRRPNNTSIATAVVNQDPDPTGGGTGDILLTSVSSASGDSYEIEIEFKVKRKE